MLIGHTLRYLLPQLLAPAAQLASTVLWTHWLAPAQMAVFTLASVAQELAYLGSLGWFAVYALRYLPAQTGGEARERHLVTENMLVLASPVASIVFAGVAVYGFPAGQSDLPTLLAVAAFFATKTIGALYAERARAQSAFTAYGILQTAGPVGGMVLGYFVVSRGWTSADALLLAYAAAQAAGTLLALPGLGMRWRLGTPDRHILRAAVAFGGPVLFLSGLSWLAENYVRYLVQWEVGAAALGSMIVGWSLGRRCASVTTMLVTTAAFPLAARLLNEGRRDQALAQLSVNAALVVAVLVPAVVGMFLLGPALATIAVAPGYRETTVSVLGVAMLGGALRNLHVHTTDQLMVLDRRIRLAAIVDVFEIATGIAASLAGLYLFGMRGAVLGQAVSSAATLAFGIRCAHVRLGFRWPWADSAKIALSAAVMGLAIVSLNSSASLEGLLQDTIAGIVVYAIVCSLLYRRTLQAMRARPE